MGDRWGTNNPSPVEMEKVETINERLLNVYGKDVESGLQTWKVLWSEDEFETRVGTFTDRDANDIFIREVTEARRLRKFSYIHNRYVLCRLMPIPWFQQESVGGEKISYEPVWTFEDKFENPLPPGWLAITLIISEIHKNAARHVGAKYQDPDFGKDPKEVQELKIQALQAELFGNESKENDAVMLGSGVFLPKNPLGDK